MVAINLEAQQMRRIRLVVVIAALAPTLAALAPQHSPAASTNAAAAQRQPASATKGRPSGPHLLASDVTLPLVLVKGYPFVRGTINGHPGKLLFDAGEPDALAVNDHAVPVPNGVPIGRGFFGSGQSFDVRRYPVIACLSIARSSLGPLRFHNMTDIRGNPGLPLEQHITPDFIGWLGTGFFGDHLVLLDYTAGTVRLLRNDAGGEALNRLTGGHAIKTTVRLGNPDHPNLKTFSVTASGVEMLGMLDTGGHDAIWVTAQQEAALKAAGALHEQSGQSDRGMLSGLTIEGQPLELQPVEITRAPAPMAKLLPRQDLPLLDLGYEFLKARRTIWDYQRATLTVLKGAAG